MDLRELEDALEEILPSGFQVSTNKQGQIVILTGLKEDEDSGDLVDFESEPDEEMDFESSYEMDEEDEEDSD